MTLGAPGEHAAGKPFCLFLSWGPPHNPYETAPPEFRMYEPAALELRPNVPENDAAATRKDLAGYYAHCSALDACVGDLLRTLRERNLDGNTIFVFTADHGDMLGSQGQRRKQRPWDEAVRVPFLLRYPAGLDKREFDIPLNTPDIMPTLLGLCGIAIPRTVEGQDLAGHPRDKKTDDDDAALIACYSPFGEWTREQGGREFRGVRTAHFTYVRDLHAPWLMYDNEHDPYQLENLCGRKEYAERQARLEALLARKLKETHDEFLPGEAYIKQWGYITDKTGTVSTQY